MVEDFKRRRNAINRLKSINKKSNVAFKEEDFSLFSSEELLTIAELSASEEIVLNRKMRESIKEMEAELEQCKAELRGESSRLQINVKSEDTTTSLATYKWISVKDRLPKESGYYLVSGKNTIWICEFLILCNMVGGWCGKPDEPIVEAWMPLPKPYKEGEQ